MSSSYFWSSVRYQILQPATFVRYILQVQQSQLLLWSIYRDEECSINLLIIEFL